MNTKKPNTRKTRKYRPTYKHPSLYQKRNKYGLGTYTRKNIPAGKIIIEETPKLLDEVYDDKYKFKLIRHLLENHKADFLNLVPHKLDDTTTIDYHDIEKYHMEFLPEIDKNTAKLYYYKIMRNWFRFSERGVILFYATKLNHSCDSNVRYYQSGDKMVFETKRPIKAGEELFDSYIGCFSCKSDRQSQLKRRYGFDCQCKKCKSETA
jgi:SET and MYND domain-containing protein